MSSGEGPLYTQIIRWIKDSIRDDTFSPGDQLPTEAELAQKFGVSRITSKRALEELKREGIITRTRGLGSFVSEASLDGPVRDDTLVSMLIPYENVHGKLINYIKGATDVFSRFGYYLTIHHTDFDPDKERMLLKRLPEGDASALLFYPLNSVRNLDVLHVLAANGFPIVTIDKYFDSVGLDAVVSDNREGGRAAVQHLIDLGHRKIAFLSFGVLDHTSSIRDRYFGYCDAIADAGLSVNLDHVVTGYGFLPTTMMRTGEQARAILVETLERFIEDGVTAVFAENDYIGFDIADALQSMGLDVPEDVSVVGFDNVEMVEQVSWKLTTVNQNIYEVGRRAASIAIDLVEKGPQGGRREVVPVQMIVRDTTAAPSGQLQRESI